MGPAISILFSIASIVFLYALSFAPQDAFQKMKETKNKILTQNNLMKNDTRNATIYSPSRIQVLCGNRGGYDDDSR